MSVAEEQAVAKPLAQIQGKRAIAKFGALSPAFLGKTTIELHKDRIVEITTGPIAKRNCQVLACEIDSAEIRTAGNPLWLVLGILTLGLFGLGLLFILLYFLAKNRFFLVTSSSNLVAAAIKNKGSEAEYEKFMKNTLKLALHCKRRS